MKLLIVLIASIFGAILYRLGGWNKGNRLFRILGVPAVVIAFLIYAGVRNPLILLLTFGLNAGMISAYWRQDSKKWGYWCHGLGLSLAVLPIVFITQHWLGFSIRCLVLTGLISVWSELISLDWLEEGGRGMCIICTLPLLLI